MNIVLVTVVTCLLLFAICYIKTGTEEKNIANLRSYPDDLQEKIKKIDKYKDKIVEVSNVKIFISNLIVFSAILFALGLFIKEDNIIHNFLNILLIGQVVNAFDFLVIDMLWWRNTKRIRFKNFEDKKLYQDPKNHLESFLRGIFMFLLVAIYVSILLTIV